MEQETQFDFVVENGALLKYEGKGGVVIIPDGVRHISPYAFYNCKNVTGIVAPVNLVSIARGAFLGCSNLKQATIPGRIYPRVKEDGVFEGLNVYFRFYACRGDEEIEDFRYTTQVVQPVPLPAPEPPQSLDDEPPLEPEGEGGDVDDDGLNDDTEGEEFIEDADSLEERMAAVIPAPEGAPSDDERRKIREFEDFIIEGSTLVKYKGTRPCVEIPDFITHIGDGAFSNSSVEEVGIPVSVVSIGKNAFAWCENLSSVLLPAELSIIDENAFANCSALTAVEIPDSVSYLGAGAFHACSALSSLRLPAVGCIGRRAFDFCVSLTELTVPEGVEEIADGAFSHCEILEKVSLPASLKRLGNWAFSDCGCLDGVSLPEGLERVGDVCFVNCVKLAKIQVPYSVRTLGRQAFAGCGGLGWARVPKDLAGQVKQNKVFHALKNILVEYI